MKKKIWTVFIAILLIVLVAIIGVILEHRSNFISVFESFIYNNEEIEKKVEKENEKLKDATEKYIGKRIRDYTPDEKEQIKNGELTEMQALANAVSEEIGNSKKKSANYYVNDTINQLSSLEVVYISYIEKILSDAIAEFKALPKEERTNQNKAAIMGEYANKIDEMEAECDGKVSNICSKLEANLKSVNADTSIIKKIKDSYENEKKLKKTYYINKYK